MWDVILYFDQNYSNFGILYYGPEGVLLYNTHSKKGFINLTSNIKSLYLSKTRTRSLYSDTQNLMHTAKIAKHSKCQKTLLDYQNWA